MKKAYKEGEGNVGDINLNLVAMLQSVGIDANPVLVSTIRHGIPIFPTRHGFNYVIARVNTPDGVVLLDATEKNSTPNVLPEKIYNFQGRVVNKFGKSEWVELFPEKFSQSKTTINVKFDDLGFKGISRKTLNNSFLLEYRNKVQNKSKDELIEGIEEENEAIEITNARWNNIDDLSKNVTETLQFETESFYEEIAGKTYISPLLFKQLKENPFKLKKREFPIFFNKPWISTTKLNLSLPETYTIENIPESVEYTLPEDLGIYKYSITQKGQNIEVQSILHINSPIISTTNYTDLQEFYKKIITKQAERIVIVKK